MGIVSKLVKWVGILLLSLIILTATWLLTRPSMSQVGIPYAAAAEAEPGVTVKWFGVTTLLIDDGETQYDRRFFFAAKLTRYFNEAPDSARPAKYLEHDKKAQYQSTNSGHTGSLAL